MNILTFDVEEWFHILDNDSTRNEKNWIKYESRIYENIERIFFLLEKYSLKATFFCCGWIAEKYPDIIQLIDNLGYEVASHSYYHQLVYEQSKTEFREDLKRSIGILEDITGKKVTSYRAPGFSITEKNKEIFEHLVEYGIINDSSIFPASRNHGGFPSFGNSEPCNVKYNGAYIREFPINTAQIVGKDIIFSGGGYFRLFPYFIIQKMMYNSDYVMTYFHPRDFDPGQPVIKELSLSRIFKSYYGLKKSFNKLIKLVEEFEFVDINEAGNIIEWENVNTIDLGDLTSVSEETFI